MGVEEAGFLRGLGLLGGSPGLWSPLVLSQGSCAFSRAPGVFWRVSGAFCCIPVLVSVLIRVSSGLEPPARVVARVWPRPAGSGGHASLDSCSILLVRVNSC